MGKLIGTLSGQSTLSGSITPIQGMEGEISNGVYIEKSVLTYNTHYEFPNLGRINTLYIAEDENKAYRWDVTNLRYYCVGSDYTEIDTIIGGNANGRTFDIG